MKKFLFILMTFFVLIGCSNISNTKNTDKNSSDKNVAAAKSDKNLSLEEKIKSILAHQRLPISNTISIVDYEIKGNYIFVVTYHKLADFSVTILKNDSNELKLMSSTNIQTDPVILAPEKDGPYMVIVPSQDKDVNDVTVFGQPTKMIQMTKTYSQDYKQEIKCWIYISDDIGKSFKDYNPDKDIKYIK